MPTIDITLEPLNNSIMKSVTKDNDMVSSIEHGNTPDIAIDTTTTTTAATSTTKNRRKRRNTVAALLRHRAARNRFGIQPVGNMLMQQDDKDDSIHKRSCMQDGLGIFGKLSEEKLLQLLPLLGPMIVSKLAMLSSTMWIYCSQDDLWKQFVCTKLAETYPQGVPHGFFNNFRGWRQLYHDKFAKSFYKDGSSTNYEDLIDIQSNKFYSDVLYMAHQCATVPLESLCDLSQCTIDKATNLSVKEFIENYETPGIPVVLKGVTKDWPCMKKWSMEYFRNVHGNRYFQAECLTLPFADYDDYVRGIPEDMGDESALYLFDRHFASESSGLDADYVVPEYFSEDLFKYLGKNARPDYRWVIMGPKRSGSTFHIDPNGTSAWNACVVGRKKWVMYPPNHIPPGVYPTTDRTEVTSPISVAEWFLQHYVPGEAYECVCEPGEIMFVPRGWWHTVINLDDSIAITQNFVSTQSLRFVMDFIQNDTLVSGYPNSDYIASVMQSIKSKDITEKTYTSSLDDRNGLEDEADMLRRRRRELQERLVKKNLDSSENLESSNVIDNECEISVCNMFPSLRTVLREVLEKNKPGLLESTGVLEDEVKREENRLERENRQRAIKRGRNNDLDDDSISQRNSKSLVINNDEDGDNDWTGFNFAFD